MPQPLKSFTKKVIEALPTPEEGRTAYDDSETPGLGLFVHPTGNKTFFWFRRVNGVPTRKTIGEFPALSVENARDKAGEFNTALARWKANEYTGPSPFTQRSGVTFGELFDEYHDVYRKAQAKNPARLPEERRRFDRYLKKWENRKMDSLRSEEFLDLHRDITKNHGRITANRTIQLGRRVVNWAGTVEGRKRWKGDNPFEFKLNKEKPRERFAQTEELQRLFASLAAEKNVDLRDFVRLALFTGQRRGDVSAMRWSELSLTATGQHQWTISNPKNGETHVVPLLPQAVAVLAERQQAAKQKEEEKKISSPFVFPSSGKSGHIRDIKRGWKKLKKNAKLANLTVHDLRRTLGSWMAMSGVSLPIIGEALGHKSLAATKVYARLQTSASRDAMMLAVGKFPALKAAGPS
jgi:integrase